MYFNYLVIIIRKILVCLTKKKNERVGSNLKLTILKVLANIQGEANEIFISLCV